MSLEAYEEMPVPLPRDAQYWEYVNEDFIQKGELFKFTAILDATIPPERLGKYLRKVKADWVAGEFLNHINHGWLYLIRFDEKWESNFWDPPNSKRVVITVFVRKVSIYEQIALPPMNGPAFIVRNAKLKDWETADLVRELWKRVKQWIRSKMQLMK